MGSAPNLPTTYTSHTALISHLMIFKSSIIFLLSIACVLASKRAIICSDEVTKYEHSYFHPTKSVISSFSVFYSPLTWEQLVTLSTKEYSPRRYLKFGDNVKISTSHIIPIQSDPFRRWKENFQSGIITDPKDPHLKRFVIHPGRELQRNILSLMSYNNCLLEIDFLVANSLRYPQHLKVKHILFGYTKPFMMTLREYFDGEHAFELENVEKALYAIEIALRGMSVEFSNGKYKPSLWNAVVVENGGKLKLFSPVLLDANISSFTAFKMEVFDELDKRSKRFRFLASEIEAKMQLDNQAESIVNKEEFSSDNDRLIIDEDANLAIDNLALDESRCYELVVESNNDYDLVVFNDSQSHKLELDQNNSHYYELVVDDSDSDRLIIDESDNLPSDHSDRLIIDESN